VIELRKLKYFAIDMKRNAAFASIYRNNYVFT